MLIIYLLHAAVTTYTLALLVRAVLSWVAPYSRHPVVVLLDSITEPVLRPLRALIPPAGGIDFSPIVAIVLLGLLEQAAARFLYTVLL